MIQPKKNREAPIFFDRKWVKSDTKLRIVSAVSRDFAELILGLENVETPSWASY